ncbi:hypothetical protein FDG2_1886 [Candidatus Protofrankia californiensis]|uniref:4Fe-4S Wbl-type domain-containing protein n=1 Tax=Candidatus Protofrankia californiensis TaxID=1839754 RepID=A0A1C3NWG6_9ACTN|nr:hypothetical protein FDG2_1886 [Candidatus Protofrankia californiensis]
MTAVSPLTDALAGLLTLPVWDLPGLRRLVDGGPRACDGVDPELFDPAGPGKLDRVRAVCAACPVRSSCLALASTEIVERVDGVPVPGVYGPEEVWGGLTAAERRELAPSWRSLVRGCCRQCGGPIPGVRAQHCPSTCRNQAAAQTAVAGRDVLAVTQAVA